VFSLPLGTPPEMPAMYEMDLMNTLDQDEGLSFGSSAIESRNDSTNGLTQL
jgi:hypothetical protein